MLLTRLRGNELCHPLTVVSGEHEGDNVLGHERLGFNSRKESGAKRASPREGPI